ncbi:MAG TPA: hypothetical protein EYQ54_13820 [Myxococcales bacterium]|nr:hypothetical protein [Myxococcales bacterium]
MIELLIDQDPTPWFSARTGNLVGGWGGGILGIVCGTLGAACGALAPSGTGRTFVLCSMTVIASLGVCVLIAGLSALTLGQPRAVWYPLILLGALPAIVVGLGIPVIRKRYAEAELRRIDAEALRRS